MSSKIIIVVLVAIIVGGGVWYVLRIPTAEAPDTVQTENNGETPKDEALEMFSGRGSLQALWMGRESGYCTFTSQADGVTSEGQAWFAGQKFAVESVSRVDGDLYTMNMINDGEQTFMWSGTAAGSMAMVMDNNEMERMGQNEAVTDAAPVSQFDVEQDVDYECRAWNPEPLTFVPPSNIKFTNFSDLTNGLFEGELRGMPEGMDMMMPKGMNIDIEAR